MSTSLKPVLGRQLRGMRQLESKISDLQNQYQSLLKERQEDITAFISTLDLASLEDPLLIGSLIFIKEKVTEKDPILEAWRDAGEKFLRRAKPKAYPRKSVGDSPHPREGREQAEDGPRPRGAEQAGDSPRIPSEKSASLKQVASPQATHQPPQKQPLQREA